MKLYSRRERAGTIIFLTGFVLFVAGILTAWMTPPMFYTTVALMFVGSCLAGGEVTVGDAD